MGVTEASLRLNKVMGFEFKFEKCLPGESRLQINLGKGQ